MNRISPKAMLQAAQQKLAAHLQTRVPTNEEAAFIVEALRKPVLLEGSRCVIRSTDGRVLLSWMAHLPTPSFENWAGDNNVNWEATKKALEERVQFYS